SAEICRTHPSSNQTASNEKAPRGTRSGERWNSAHFRNLHTNLAFIMNATVLSGSVDLSERVRVTARGSRPRGPGRERPVSSAVRLEQDIEELAQLVLDEIEVDMLSVTAAQRQTHIASRIGDVHGMYEPLRIFGLRPHRLLRCRCQLCSLLRKALHRMRARRIHAEHLRRRVLQQLCQLAQQAIEQAASDPDEDRKSTRLNSSHVKISYAVFCLKKKKDSPP